MKPSPVAFDSLFARAPEPPTSAALATPWKVLLVDDEPDIHAALRLALKDAIVEGRALQLLDASSTADARTLLEQHRDIALVLLDVVMESEHAGLDLVRYIRHELGNRTVQVVIVTGQPGYAPQRAVVAEYEIDGYRLKSELSSDAIFVSVYAALRTYQAHVDLDGHRRNLELQVDERTAELVRARDRAEAANRAKNAFLINASHELRTPMNAVVGLTELALEEATSPAQRDRLRTVVYGARQLLAVISDVCEMAEIEADRLDDRRLVFRLGEAVEDALVRPLVAARAKGLLFDVDWSAGVRARIVTGHPRYLGEVLQRLLDNAVKFTDAGGIALRIRLDDAGNGDLRLRCEVEDTGVGLTADEQARLFLPFEQGDPSLTRRFGGLGLGLAISRRLVERMGGAIGTADPAAGRGSAFWFTAQLRDATLEAASPASGRGALVRS